MIIARAPARISFGGGGTDLAAYYERFGGLVLSAAISCYCTVTVSPTEDGSIRLRSDSIGLSRQWPRGVRPDVDGDHRLAAAVIERFYSRALEDTGVEVVIDSEVPAGSGLGSSSTVTVGLVTALAAFTGRPVTPAQAADMACDIEINRLGMPIGRQDQYASAFGGVNVIEFTPDATRVRPLLACDETLAELDARLLLFSTGQTRRAADILQQQQADTHNDGQVLERLHKIKQFAVEMAAALERKDLEGFGHLLHECWLTKRGLSSRISTGDIDRWYEAARAAGALGGKVTGAGGGGFLLFYCPPGSRSAVRAAMAEDGLQELPFSFDYGGVVSRSVRDAGRLVNSTL